jgi:DNA invertase Pin-like site-specific DNA recombinase
VLGGLADVERDLIRTRTAEGRSRAKARGQHMGPPPCPYPAAARRSPQTAAGGATLKELAMSYDVSITTIARLEADLERERRAMRKPDGKAWRVPRWPFIRIESRTPRR